MIAPNQKTRSLTVAPGVTCVPLTLGGALPLANVIFVETAGGAWSLVDTGVAGFARHVLSAAVAQFSPDRPPQAIILTHGHFDHIGNARRLATHWDVPIYAPRRELPYLTGEALLPPLDPTVGGFMANLARLFPPSGEDFTGLVRPLPEDFSVPTLPEWNWVPTPGHTPGHVSLFHSANGLLIAGDAITTMDQERAGAALSAAPQVLGPPTYATSDWEAAGESVRALAHLAPRVIVAGHGQPMSGMGVSQALRDLADHFAERAIPRHGRYVAQPARFANDGRMMWVPPAPIDPVPGLLAAAGGGAVVAAWLLGRRRGGR